jgi:toxin-antitoxin system PIN domain toxin
MAAGAPHLLDVSVLVALFDPAHLHHDAAHAWFEVKREGGWATCPLPENGFGRVLSNPACAGRRTTVADAVARMARFTASGHHTFWADERSLLDRSVISAPLRASAACSLSLPHPSDGMDTTGPRTMRPSSPSMSPHAAAMRFTGVWAASTGSSRAG